MRSSAEFLETYSDMRKGMKQQPEKVQEFVQDPATVQDLQALREFEVPKVMIRGEELLGNCAWEDWNQVTQAFKHHPDLPLEQWGKNGGDAYFESASVRIGWKDDKIYLLAAMEDQSIVITAHRDNKQLWEGGDAVEIFLKSTGASECYQLQVAPNGDTLQLGYPDAAAIATLRHTDVAGLSNFLIREPVFAVRSQVKDKKWRVLIEIPGRILFSGDNPLLGCACWISVCRHDHWMDARPPCHSSTSPHFETDFHQQKDWGLVDFVNARPGTA